MSGYHGSERRKAKRYDSAQEHDFYDCQGARELHLILQQHVKMDDYRFDQIKTSLEDISTSTKQASIDINAANELNKELSNKVFKLIIQAAFWVIVVLGGAFVSLLLYIWANRNVITI